MDNHERRESGMNKTLRGILIGVAVGVLSTLIVQWLTEPTYRHGFLISSAYAAAAAPESKFTNRACHFKIYEDVEEENPDTKVLEVVGHEERTVKPSKDAGTVTARSEKSGKIFAMTLQHGVVLVDTKPSTHQDASFQGVIYFVCDVTLENVPDRITFSFQDIRFTGTGGGTTLISTYISDPKNPVLNDQDVDMIYPIMINTDLHPAGNLITSPPRNVELPFPKHRIKRVGDTITFRFVIAFRDAWGNSTGTVVQIAEPELLFCYNAILRNC